MAVAVLASCGIPLMPTSSYRARKLLKSGRAVIHSYRPVFTIRLLNREGGETQPVELKCDTGYAHIGISIASEKHEYINEQRDLLKDETEHHNDARKYRRERRNRLRYRKPRFDNRRGEISRGNFAPSLRNKRDVHVDLIRRYCAVIPVTKVVAECGQFDTQALKAFEEGKPVPQGTDYQHGEQYGYATLREAVFARDGYRCILCGKSAIRDKVILRMHHLGYYRGDRSNRMPNLGSVCTGCHTPANHKPGGKLYGLKPKLKPFKGASFMTSVRYSMIDRLKKALPDTEICMTYGAATKEARKALSVKKTHSNDAYCMGTFHPKRRADFMHYEKRRRNSRILEKFYDAKYIDVRDGKKKSGTQLSCGRTNRSEMRTSGKNERVFREQRVSPGRRSIRHQRYPFQPGDTVTVSGRRYTVIGTQNKGDYVAVRGGKPVSVKKIKPVKHCNGWAVVA